MLPFRVSKRAYSNLLDYSTVFATFEVENLGGYNFTPHDPNWQSAIRLYGINNNGNYATDTSHSGEDRGNHEKSPALGLKARGTLALSIPSMNVDIDTIWRIIGVENVEKQVAYALFEVRLDGRR